MFSKYSKNFSTGVIIGALICLLYWYWQKSTKAEDGALALLDRLKQADDRLQRAYQAVADQELLEAAQESVAEETAVSPSNSVDDLTLVKGIGPVFAARLQQANITKIAQIAELQPEKLSEILNIASGRAEQILDEVHLRL